MMELPLYILNMFRDTKLHITKLVQDSINEHFHTIFLHII